MNLNGLLSFVDYRNVGVGLSRSGFKTYYDGPIVDSLSGGGPGSGRHQESVTKVIDLLEEKYPINPKNKNERMFLISNQKVGDFEVTERDGRLRIKSIQSDIHDSGVGSLILTRILHIADKLNVTVELTASSKGSQNISTDDLKKWYSRHGFINEPGFDTSLGYMIRQPKKQIQAGGPGSGRHKTSRKKRVKDATKQAAGLRSYNPSTRAKQQQATSNEKALTKVVKGSSHVGDNQPFDVMVKSSRIAFEVKTKIDGKKNTITMHPASLERKVQAAKAMKLKAVYTVIFDDRPGQNKVYIAKGLGSFKIKLRDGSLNPKLKEINIKNVKDHL